MWFLMVCIHNLCIVFTICIIYLVRNNLLELSKTILFPFQVVNIIGLIQSAQGDYEYPKPSISFELPNRILQNSEEHTLKTSNIDITKTLDNFLPNNDYRHSQQYTNEEQIQSGELKLLLESTVQSGQQNFEVGVNQDLNPTPFNTYSIDAREPIQNAVAQSSFLKDLNSVQQPVLSPNYPELILNINNNVPPLVNLQNSKHELLDNLRVPQNELPLAFNVHQVENEPPLVNLNINQVETVNEHRIPQLTNIPHVEAQQNYIGSQIVQESHQNENSAIRIQDFVPNVLNILNSVQPYSGEFNEQVVDTQENRGDLSNLNVQQTQFNVQSSQAPLYEESGLLNNQQSSLSLQSLNAANIATPVITKSISFHVPPPDIEENSVVPGILPARKTYKIIFVKVPNYAYNQQLQANLLSRLAPVEEKTIVYVLSKKPEVTEQVFLPQPTKVSEHEVLYVQYKGDQRKDSEHISENVPQLPINSAGAAYIEPRHN